MLIGHATNSPTQCNSRARRAILVMIRNDSGNDVSVRQHFRGDYPQALKQLVMQRQQKITFGQMRANCGPTRVLVYCSDHKCSHSVVIDAACWPDDLRLSDLEDRFVCQICGRRGADVRPLFERARMGE